jgi:hypothetical protein
LPALKDVLLKNNEELVPRTRPRDVRRLSLTGKKINVATDPEIKVYFELYEPSDILGINAQVHFS